MTKEFNVYVQDIGDPTVGLSPLMVFKAQLDENLVEAIKEYGSMKEFKKELESLICKYMEPETSYDVYDDEDIEKEAEADRIAEEAWNGFHNSSEINL